LQQNGDKKKQPEKWLLKHGIRNSLNPSASDQADETCKTWTEQPDLKGQESSSSEN